MLTFFRSAIVVFLTAASMAASAAVMEWSYSVSLHWDTSAGATDFTSGSGTTEASSTRLSWGSSSGSIDPAVNASRSGLLIQDSLATGTVVTNGDAALTNAITHFNHPISLSFSLLTFATLVSEVVLTPLDPAGAPLPPFSLTFGINFSETPNDPGAGGCVIGAPPCPDIFVLAAGSLNQSFDYLGDTYFVSIFEATSALAPLTEAACAMAGGSFPCIGFVTPENTDTTAQFAFLITSQPIGLPEPQPLVLMAIALVMMVGLGGRRKH